MEEKLVQALYSYMVDIATMFGADRDRATKELKESLDFEIELAKVSDHVIVATWNFVNLYAVRQSDFSTKILEDIEILEGWFLCR